MEKLNEVPGLVPKDKVDDYLDEHGIRVQKLPNGLTLIGANRQVPDMNRANLEVYFPRGAYFDPIGQRGLLHIYEHLISREPGMAMMKIGNLDHCKFNMQTLIYQMKIEAGGIANPSFLNYGIWPILDLLYKNLVSPSETTQDRLDREKEVVRKEFNLRYTDNKAAMARDFKFKLLFGDNPIIQKPDNLEAAERTTLEDIKDFKNGFLIANGVFAEIWTQGQPEILDLVFAGAQDKLSQIPQGKNEPPYFDFELAKVINSDLKGGRVHALDTGSISGQIDMSLVWSSPSMVGDPRTMALRKFWPFLSGFFFERLRDNGQIYTSSQNLFETEQKSPQGTMFNVLNLSTDKSKDLEELSKTMLQELRHNVLPKLTDTELEKLLERTYLSTIVTPIRSGKRISDVTKGLRFYGRPIDSQFERNTEASISKDDLKYWRDKLLDEDPAFIITGDLGKH